MGELWSLPEKAIPIAAGQVSYFGLEVETNIRGAEALVHEAAALGA